MKKKKLKIWGKIKKIKK